MPTTSAADSVHTDIEKLRSIHPEWTPWLTVVEHVMHEVREGDGTVGRWGELVPQVSPLPERAPLLARAGFTPDREAIEQWLRELTRCAAASGLPAMAGLVALRLSQEEALMLFMAAIDADDAAIGRLADRAGRDATALQAIATLLPIPFLHACRRGWTSQLAGRAEGFCPCCGGWPAYAEVRGIERSRQLRCGRCGTAWLFAGMNCPYCRETDHRRLGALVPDQEGLSATIEVCNGCRGYIKSFTVLTGSAPESVILQDLASTELDIAAVARDYLRPRGLGCTLSMTLAGSSGVLLDGT